MVKLTVLGNCKIETPHAVITPRAANLFGLALYLILERGRPIPRRRLIELFWIDRHEQAARHPLREALRKLRRKGIPVANDDHMLHVFLPEAAVSIDVDSITQFDRDQLVLHDYTVLPGYEHGFSPAHSDWIDDTRFRINNLVVAQLLEIAEKFKLAADWKIVLQLAQRLIALDPENSRATALLNHTRNILWSSKKRTLSGLAVDLGVRTACTHENPSHSNTFANQGGSRDTRLIGRVEDLRILTAALEAAANGSGGGIYLYGSPGVGKSRLVHELAHIGRADSVAVGFTKCQHHDIHRPLSVFIDLIPSLKVLPGVHGCYPHTIQYLDRLTCYEADIAKQSIDEDVEYFYEKIRQALFDLIEAIAHEQPLLLIIEDIQWSDPQSWALLRDMVARTTSHEILFVFTSREPWQETASGPIPPHIINHHLLKLNDTTALQYAQEYSANCGRQAEQTFLIWCAQVADGNPYFIEELLNHWITSSEQYSAPKSLSLLIDRRLQSLDEISLRVLQTCAALGKYSTLERLHSALEYPNYALLSAIETLDQAGMLAAPSTSLDGENHIFCRHEILATQSLQCLSEQGLRLLHHRLGTILENEVRYRESVSLLWECMQHWHAAGDTGRALDIGLSCATHLTDIGLLVDTVNICKRMLQLCSIPAQRLRILTLYTKGLHLTREWTEIFDLFEDLHHLRQELGYDVNSHDDLELAYLDASWHLKRDWQNVIERANSCISATSASLTHRVEAGLILLKLGTNLGETELMHHVYRSLGPLTATTDIESELRLSFELIYHAICGQAETCVDVSQKLLTLARKRFKGVRLIRTLLNCASGFRRSGHKELGDSLYIEAFHQALQEEAYALAGQAAHQLVLSELESGNIGSAREWACKFEQLNRPSGELWGQRNFIVSATRIAIELQDFEAAERLFSPHAASFLNDPVVSFRATATAVAIRLGIAQRVDTIHIRTLTAALMNLHFKIQATGLHDFVCFSLYLGLVYTGDHQYGQRLLKNYVSQFRRDRFPVSEEIAHALQAKHEPRVLVLAPPVYEAVTDASHE